MTATKNKKQYLVAMGKRIRAARENANLSPEELGRALGVHRTTVNGWENGHNGTPAEQLAAICHVLRVSADYLLLGR